MIRILVYEDEPEVVQALVNAFANGLKPGEEIEIIWFETGFDPPRKKSIQPGEPFAPELNPEIVWFDTRDPRRERPIYPIKVEAGYEPWLIRIETQHAAPTWPPQERGKCEWHQEEFREVILDIYHEPSPGRSTEVGRDFADWFELANFRGPRSVITRRGRPLNWPIKYKRFHKKEDPDWDVKCVDKTLSELRNEKEQQIAGRIEAFHVDCLGRNPTKFLSDFDAQSLDAIRATTDRVNERIPKDWHALYFGPDRTVADYLCKYFRLRLYTNKARAIAPISELAEVLLEINQLRGEKPRVVWLDFGEEAIFDNKSATELADTKCIKREGDKIVDEIPVFPPKGDRNLAANLVFFILAKEERVSSTLMETFERCNVFFVSRSDILKHPHVWTVINVGELADSYANFSREYQLAQGEIVEKTIRDRWKVKFRRGSLNPRSFSSKRDSYPLRSRFHPAFHQEQKSKGESTILSVK